jgi:hypothetical protein
MSESWDDLRKRRIVKNEQAFRDYNDRRVAFEEQTADADELVPFVCECGDPACIEVLDVTVDGFMDAHSAPNRFTVKPGHVIGQVERVAEQHDGYWVVEKHESVMATSG